MEKQFELKWIAGISEGLGYTEQWSYQSLKLDFFDHDIWKTIKSLKKHCSCLYIEDEGMMLMITRL